MITKTQHTPGPWMLTYPLPDIANICSNQKPLLGFTIANDKDRANARLIAAAPELLEALILAQRIIFETNAASVKSAEYGKICDAITKARGLA